MNKKLLFSIVFFLALVLINIPSFAAKIIKSQGNVSIKRGAVLQKAQKKMHLIPGDIIITGSKSFLVVQLEDKSIFTVESLSILKLDTLEVLRGKPGQSKKKYRVKLKLKIGGVRASVKRVRGLKKRFQVQTPKGTASVRGTIEIVRYSYQDGMHVFVVKGIVDVFNLLGISKQLAEGENIKVVDVDPKTLPEGKLEELRDVLCNASQTDSDQQDHKNSTNLPDSNTFEIYDITNIRIDTDCKP